MSREYLGAHQQQTSENNRVGSRFSIIGGKVQLNKFSLDKMNQLSNGTYEMDPVEAEVVRYFFDKHMNSELTKALK